MTILKEGMFSYAKICVEVNLDKGILETFLLTLDNWKHENLLDYKKLLLKCKVIHEYGHFAENCKKAVQGVPLVREKEE
jgi:hypothetical protein